MSLARTLLALALTALLTTALPAQSTLPTALQPLPAQTLVTAGTTITIDLREYFGLPGVSGQVVQFDTVVGKFNVELLANAAPKHVANFLQYVAAGSYTNSFFHRSAALDSGGISIVQGGGYTWSGSSVSTIGKFSSVPLEYNLPNSIGTLAAARTSNINSATSEWYFNVRDNSTTLGPLNGGGYTVFGRVIGSGMTVVSAIARLDRANAGGAFSELPVRNYTAGANLVTANFVIVNSIGTIPVYPGSGTSVLAFSGTNSAGSIVNAEVVGPYLLMQPLASGSASITIQARDTNGNLAQGTFTATVTGPLSQSAQLGSSANLVAPAGAGTYQWQRNGADVTAPNSATVAVTNLQPASTGLFSAKMTTGTSTTLSRYAIVGVTSSEKVVGNGAEVGPNIAHQNGNIFDQLLLQGSSAGAAATFTADAGQITRMSFIDLDDDIVQVEFSGAGSVSVVLVAPTGPAAPVKYNQPDVTYMRGHAGIVVTGADETTNLSIFSVGRATAFDRTGAYDFLKAPSDTNVPANNGSPLFVGHQNTVYEGRASLGFVAIMSTNGRFGGLRAANASFYGVRGLTGVYAPDVRFDGPVFVGQIAAYEEAYPALLLGSGGDVRITGGDLLQPNSRAVQVSGISRLVFQAGSTSGGSVLPAQNNRGRLEQNGTDVTAQIVVNP
jgi:cyclophilin family peptidyl-prolyl cis-trans isomerase